MERNNITVSTLYKNKINPKMSSMGCNLNIFDLLEYIKNFNTSLVNLEVKYIRSMMIEGIHQLNRVVNV